LLKIQIFLTLKFIRSYFVKKNAKTNFLIPLAFSDSIIFASIKL